MTTQIEYNENLLKIIIPKLCAPHICDFASLVYHSLFGVLAQWNFSATWPHLPLWFILQYCLEIQSLMC